MFDSFELSRFLGRPVHLFIFTRQGVTWRFCTADRDLVIGGFTYVSAQISRSEIKQTVERAKDKITISMAYLRNPSAPAFPSTQVLGDNWHPYIPSDPVYVTCLATHVGDPGVPSVEWMGRVTQPTFTDVELQLTCEPATAFAQAVNQGAKWQRGCWKAVHSTGPRGCNLPMDTFRVNATVTNIAGLVLTAAEFATAPLALDGGWIEWTRANGVIERRTIMSHITNTITLLYGGADLTNGLHVIARPGCAQTWDACDDRGNTDNYGGAFFMPVKDPTGDSMSWG